ncbi:hypothetical protein PUMCH_001152 [Australozyma saopauloensis]|uniref:t-SNARE coiled-coil homology domain-containing protein n=1 Tax=Australozyma saopauloensis TaxID=291208 RepID=A0AAX4H608_9ASCO|nr:hypothetical protein PUMCH_001152 [[Candida] saopauloensis]
MLSSIQNRTLEFQQCVASFDKINRTGQQQNVQPIKRSQFSMQAASIAKDIAQTTDLLLKLAQLAKRKTLFDDKPAEINELAYVIKQDIFKISQNLKNLKRAANGDSSVNSDKDIRQYSDNVCKLLNSKMQNVSGEFATVLGIRQKNELENKSRKENFLSAATNLRQNSQTPRLIDGDRKGASPLQSYGENPYSHIHEQKQDSPYGNKNGDLLSIPDQTRQLLLLEEQGNEYIQERSSAVETIEATINEVGNLFQQLASMVSEQGEQIQRIDQNVDDIDMNIMGAQRELLKFYTRISSNRWLFLKVFGVLLVFFLLWVLVS